MCIEIIRDPHPFGLADLKCIEYCFFKTEAQSNEYSLHKSKIVLHLAKALPHDFDLSDEVQSLEFPFLYLLSGNTI